LSGHVCNDDYVIDWENVKMIDLESDKTEILIRGGDMDQEDPQHELR